MRLAALLTANTGDPFKQARALLLGCRGVLRRTRVHYVRDGDRIGPGCFGSRGPSLDRRIRNERRRAVAAGGVVGFVTRRIRLGSLFLPGHGFGEPGYLRRSGGRGLFLGGFDLCRPIGLGHLTHDGLWPDAGLGFDPRGNHGHPDPPLETLIEGRAEDDVRILVHFVADPVGGLVDLEQGDVVAGGDIDQHTLGAAHGGIVEQRIGDRRLRGLDRAAFTLGFAGSHHRLAHLAHHRADVGEVEVDQARHHHQIGDPANARMEDVVRHLESLGKGRLLIGDPEQVLVRNDQQRIDELMQLFEARLGDLHPVGAFELEWFGDHAHRQDVALPSGTSDDRGGAGTGSTAETGGDEHHIGILQIGENIFEGFFGRRATDIRI